MMKLEQIAKGFATQKHSGQLRKYTGEPYIVHPVAVAEIVRSVTHTKEMIAAALLHDTVEDTDATLDEVEALFGAKVAELVEALTDVSKPEDGNRKKRKTMDREHTAKASPDAKTIKLADLIDNTSSIVKHDKKFAKVYLKEKALLLDVLTEGDHKLHEHAKELIARHGFLM